MDQKEIEEKLKTFMNIQTYNNEDKTPEEFDNLNCNRFNIRNYIPSKNYQYKNFYMFKITDPNSPTGYSCMAINKQYATKIKNMLDK